MLATKGGNAMRDHALQHLRAIAPLGRQAAKATREGKRAVEVWEQTGQVMASGEVRDRPNITTTAGRRMAITSVAA